MNLKRWLIVGAAIIVAGGAWTACKKRSKRGGEAQTVSAMEGPIEEAVEATGAVSPLNRVEIKPPIAGRIEKLLVEEGDRVKVGQILAWMSSSDRAAILDAARAQGPEELKKWEDSYKPTPIVAPLSGVLILKNVVVGQTVDAGTVLYAMSDELIVLAQVDESDIGRVHAGMTTSITLDAYSERTVEGKVFDVLYEGKNVSNVITYGVKVRPASVPPWFRSQMTANVRFIVARKDKAVLLVSSAVRDSGVGPKQVRVLAPDGTSALREVKTGIESGENVEIVSGLEAGEQVLVSQGKYTPQKAMASSPLSFGPPKMGGGSSRATGNGGSRKSSASSSGGPPPPP
ncbi:MAG: efflux RND transporter periplasmic adaptor subunit [Elusimicrobiota bacterium]|jgi:macrolide-specific efflux system membrane fusion protein